jgi:hypothetical protein
MHEELVLTHKEHYQDGRHGPNEKHHAKTRSLRLAVEDSTHEKQQETEPHE